jgi:hypothetical protein
LRWFTASTTRPTRTNIGRSDTRVLRMQHLA